MAVRHCQPDPHGDPAAPTQRNFGLDSWRLPMMSIAHGGPRIEHPYR